jgi:hypothetical protein
MSRKKIVPVELTRKMVEQVAYIIGPQSAAAQALAEADKHDGPVRFLQTPGTIFVVKLPKEEKCSSAEFSSPETVPSTE